MLLAGLIEHASGSPYSTHRGEHRAAFAKSGTHDVRLFSQWVTHTFAPRWFIVAASPSDIRNIRPITGNTETIT